MPDNLAFLTHSHKAIAAKKSAKRDQIKEILFDHDARAEFLTGFHKRKLAKADAARKKAIERQKQERLETRREQRRMLREQAVQNAAQVEKAYGAILADDDDDGNEWTGILGPSGRDKGKQKEQEYEDDEMLATVTVVEEFDPDSIIHGPNEPPPRPPFSTPQPAKPSAKRNKDSIKKKTKAKKVRYETNDARKVERTKQRARRTEKAELAGGKASRKKGNGGSKKKSGSRR